MVAIYEGTAVGEKMTDEMIKHYDNLIKGGNDPVLDPPALQVYMDKWDGALFMDWLGLNPSQRVLEIGCGTGRLAVKVAPLVKTFCGIDISPETIEAAKKHLNAKAVTLICADFLSYDFSESFDLIYSSLTFLHIKDKKAAIQKVFTLLSPGGRFVLSIDKNQNNEIDFGAYKLKIYPDNPENIMHLLKLTGFETIRQFETELASVFSADKPIS